GAAVLVEAASPLGDVARRRQRVLAVRQDFVKTCAVPPRGSLDHAFAWPAAAYPDRYSRPLHRRWQKRHAVYSEILAGVGKFVSGPQAGNDVQCFIELF